MEPLYQLTASDVAAFRKGDSVVVQLDPARNLSRVGVIKRKAHDSTDPFDRDQEHAIAAPIDVYGFGRYAEALPPGFSAFELVGLYHSQNTAASTLFRSLRVGDEVSFQFYPDHHTNDSVALAGLHADALLMTVIRGAGKVRKILRYVVEIQVSSHGNSARMIRGLPYTKHYQDVRQQRGAA